MSTPAGGPNELELLRAAAPVHARFIETFESLGLPLDKSLEQKDRDAAASLAKARENFDKWKDSLRDGEQDVTRLADALDDLINAVGVQGLILIELKEKLKELQKKRGR